MAFLTLAWVGLVIAAIASRYWLIDWPNFKPAMAIAIFLGFLCNHRLLSVAGVFAMMLISDAMLGFYDLKIMAGVYVSILLACGMGILLKQFLQTRRSVAMRIGSVSLVAITTSVWFFVLTNTAVWFAGWYAGDFNGLIAALCAGIPFFKFTLASNVFFSLMLFSVYFAWSSLSVRGIVVHRLAT